MRILIRKTGNRKFFAGAGVWTIDPAEALDFEKSPKAIDFIVENHPAAVEVVLQFGSGGPTVSVFPPQPPTPP